MSLAVAPGLLRTGVLRPAAAAAAAFPVVADTAATVQTSNSSSWTLNVPAHNSGDLLVMAAGADGNPSTTSIGAVNGAAWTSITDTANGSDCILKIWWVRATSNQASATTVTLTLGASEQGVARCWRVTGAHGSTPPQTPTAATGTSANPDPPSLNPTGWLTEKTLWLALAATDAAVSASSAPANYTNLFSDVSGGGAGAGLHTARRENEVETEDPGTFTLSGSDQWVAQTVGIRPGGGSATPTLDTAASYWICKNNATFYQSSQDRLLDQIGTFHLQLGTTNTGDTNDPTFTNDGTYECLDFDGTNDWLQGPASTDPYPSTGDFTLVVLVNWDAVQDGDMIVNNRASTGIQVKVRSSNLLRITVSSSSGTIDEDHSTTLSAGTRYLVGIQRTGTTYKAIVETVSTGKTLANAVPGARGNTRFGGDDFGASPTDGKIFGAARFDNATVDLAAVKSEILALAAL